MLGRFQLDGHDGKDLFGLLESYDDSVSMCDVRPLKVDVYTHSSKLIKSWSESGLKHLMNSVIDSGHVSMCEGGQW